MAEKVRNTKDDFHTFYNIVSEY